VLASKESNAAFSGACVVPERLAHEPFAARFALEVVAGEAESSHGSIP
jgi:hypothetical protein